MLKHSEKTVLEFTEMMELFLESGLSVRDALEAFAVIGRNSTAGSLGRMLLEYIHKGASFAQAVELMEGSFPPIYRRMVRVGNTVGSVEQIFPRLSNYLRNKKKLQDKILAALIYPLLVLITAFCLTLGTVFFVMPKMELIFSGFVGGGYREQYTKQYAGTGVGAYHSRIYRCFYPRGSGNYPEDGNCRS
ncbi:MAG: type II secretion system F family protein [Treponema sp.]|jgi:type II secretory pathway component PulF|nr:type II secretion system F family protein [Treponema sp.]